MYWNFEATSVRWSFLQTREFQKWIWPKLHKQCPTSISPTQKMRQNFKVYCWGPWPCPCPWMQTASLATCLGGTWARRVEHDSRWISSKASTALNDSSFQKNWKKVKRSLTVNSCWSGGHGNADQSSKATFFTAIVFKWLRKYLKCSATPCTGRLVFLKDQPRPRRTNPWVKSTNPWVLVILDCHLVVPKACSTSY